MRAKLGSILFVKIRQEYAAVSDEAWRVGRGEFLAGMLARTGTVFKTAWGIESFEQLARANMRRELAALETKE